MALGKPAAKPATSTKPLIGDEKSQLTLTKNLSQSSGAVVNLAGRFDKVQGLHDQSDSLLPSSLTDKEVVAKATSFVNEDDNAVVIAITDLRQPRSASKTTKKKRTESK